MNGLVVRDIHITYQQGEHALAGVSFTQEIGEVVAVLGPSGCGKSTLLAVIAGLVEPDRGSVSWNGEDLRNIPPHQRGFGLMFQDYALFPHMRVRENVAFGLRMQGLPREAVEQQVSRTLEIVGLPGFEGRDVNQLSGGEQQRVALARAIAPKPGLLMLDEPLGSLDRKLREKLLYDLREIIRSAQQTTLYVTHDQEEAFSLADRLVVMRKGEVVQIGTPQEIYQHPNSVFVARFVGLDNLVEGEARGNSVETPLGVFPLQENTHGSVLVLLRPNSAKFGDKSANQTGKVQEVIFQGETSEVRLKLEDFNLVLSFELSTSSELPAVGETVSFWLDTDKALQSFPAGKDG